MKTNPGTEQDARAGEVRSRLSQVTFVVFGAMLIAMAASSAILGVKFGLWALSKDGQVAIDSLSAFVWKFFDIPVFSLVAAFFAFRLFKSRTRAWPPTAPVDEQLSKNE